MTDTPNTKTPPVRTEVLRVTPIDQHASLVERCRVLVWDFYRGSDEA